MSFVDRVRVGFANPTVNPLAVVLAVGVLLDFVTTTAIFLSPGFEEGNELLVTLAGIHLAVPLAYNLGYGIGLVVLYSVVGGWLGRVGAAMAAPSAFLGVNNVLYFALGSPSLLVVMFGNAISVAIAYGIPAFGFGVGTTWHVARERSLPWRLVAATVAVVLLGFAVAATVT